MNPGLLLNHFHRISEAPNAVQRLRSFILDLAVRGKLVEQNMKDEPASILISRIEGQKARPGLAAGTTKLVANDEAPFEIPPNWVWVRLGDLCSKTGSGSTPRGGKSVYQENGVPFLRSQNVYNDGLRLDDVAYISDQTHEKMSGTAVEAGDLLLNITGGSIGRCCLVPSGLGQANVSQHVAIIRVVSDGIQRFLHQLVLSPYFQSFILGEQTGAGRGGLPKNRMDRIPVALPPLAEQYRIVSRADELMILCDQLKAARAEREGRRDRLIVASNHLLKNGTDAGTLRKHAHFYITHLPSLATRPAHIRQLRQTVLDLAVRGQLVRQDPNDEPAPELLKRIRSEKKRLATEKKQRREIELSPVDPRRAPFSLPVGWAWARFPELGIFGRGKSKYRPRNDPSLFEGGKHLLVQTGDVARSHGIIETYTSMYNDLGLAQSMKWPRGTLCITIAANIADSRILSFDACFPDSVVGFVPASPFPNARYFEYFIRTAKSNLLEFAPATAQKNINLEILNAVLVPLPPLTELSRIVTRVDELMALCDRLEAQLTNVQAETSLLLESVLHDALSDAFLRDAPNIGNAKRNMVSIGATGLGSS